MEKNSKKLVRPPKHEFRSVDSTPVGFSVRVALWRAPLLLVVFVLLSAGAIWSVENLPVLQTVFHGGDLITAPFSGSHSMPLRIFIICYMVSFGIFCQGKILSRLGLITEMVVSYLLFCALLDLTALVYSVVAGIVMPLTVIEILSGILGYAVYSFKLLERGNMPSRIPIQSAAKPELRWFLRLAGVVFLACVIAFFVINILAGPVAKLHSIALLGGIGPGVLLILPVTFILLYILARSDTARENQSPYTPPLTIIIPAHNEEYVIEKTIQAIEIAAKTYGGPVSILVMDNNSTDDTAKVAQAALANCEYSLGRVVPEPRPGKSHALNAALDATQTEFVIRIDADTQVGPDSLTYAMRSMRSPKVGVVGGLPLPPGGGMFDHARLLELMVKHGFYSVGLSAVNSVVGVPGMFAAYRVDIPRRLGGFVQGMNGEDTDMSLRIGELGYRSYVDPRITYVSEVPTTFEHLREQRIRWFRSVFHVSARCRDLIYSNRLSVRGKIMLPYMLLNSAMRAMMVPMILFGILILVGPGLKPRSIPWQAILAVVIGAPAMMAVMCAFLNKSLRGVLYVPEYILFRLLRSYLTLESNLSIVLKDHRKHLYAPSELERPANKEPRDA
jgi:cellulose synthase/poly-beta-1,6-N-acetylglucosamine synthase-like glycosyltransferase